MKLKNVQFLSLLLTALGLGSGMAHALELPNKINLPAAAYLTVQQIYRGWALLGIVELATLLATLTVTFMMRKQRGVFPLALIAFLCISANLIIFFSFIFPANQQTNNWTVLPDNWQALRTQWEYGHAVNAALHLVALISLIFLLLVRPARVE